MAEDLRMTGTRQMFYAHLPDMKGRRDRSSGSPGGLDLFGARQYALLMDVEIPLSGS